MSRQPVPPLLREQLINSAKEKDFFDMKGEIYYPKFTKAWEEQQKCKRVRRDPPSQKTVKKFFTKTESHDTWVVEGLCWMLLNMSLTKWEKRNSIELRSFNTNSTHHIDSQSPLSGLWLSRYSYIGVKPDNTPLNGNQFSLEHIEVLKGGKIRGGNIVGVSDNSVTHLYTLHGEIHLGRFIPGIWVNQARDHVGSFMLCLHTTKRLLIGKHLGNDEENSIQHGPWTWIKINVDEVKIEAILERSQEAKLQDYDSLNKIFEFAYKDRQIIELHDVLRSV